jgi:hypothetical protein
MILYWFPEFSWQLGKVTRPPFSHAVHYRCPAATFACDVNTLLIAAFYSQRLVVLGPAFKLGCTRACPVASEGILK